ncbi:MAG: tRNA (N6-threonylcarbamoyladenosine(37)-N6)-methyltransferase TrmO [Chlamydiota bacterium]|nr:tRNA (N6-threonylcarbamoyladenosine(37)-N6)-methyltransferase TrmO [Chlamydiota bacterium]
MNVTLTPIGKFYSIHQEKYHLQRQGGLVEGYEGKITLNPNCNYEQALEDLDGFDTIWLIYSFHKNKNWKPKVLPPRGGKKKGVFATRSPHRPNAIGMSAVKLVSIDGLNLYIKDHDLIDGTPILDLKPYINYCDRKLSERQGWVESLPEENSFDISFSETSTRQLDFLYEVGKLNLKTVVSQRLMLNPFPYKNNRIQCIDVTMKKFVLAVKTWRVEYLVAKETQEIEVLRIYSGYDKETLEGKKSSKWDDVPLHQLFTCRNWSNILNEIGNYA